MTGSCSDDEIFALRYDLNSGRGPASAGITLVLQAAEAVTNDMNIAVREDWVGGAHAS